MSMESPHNDIKGYHKMI